MLHEKRQPVTKHNEDAKQYIPVVTAMVGRHCLFFLFITQTKQNFKIQKRQSQKFMIQQSLEQHDNFKYNKEKYFQKCRLSSTMSAYCTKPHRIQICIDLFSFAIVLPELQRNFGTVQNQMKKYFPTASSVMCKCPYYHQTRHLNLKCIMQATGYTFQTKSGIQCNQLPKSNARINNN